MDAGGIGALLGVGIMALIGLSVCIYDRCIYKVKNLFNHVQI